MISLRLLPVAVRLATKARVRGSESVRTWAMIHSALLAARSPPRLSRWRLVLPDEASTGLAPHTAVLGNRGRLTRQHGAGGVLRIDRVALALAAPPGPVRAVDFPDLQAPVGQQPGQPVPVAAGAFHSRIRDRAEPGQPLHQLGVPGVRGGEVPHRQAPPEPVQYHRDVHILVRVDPYHQAIGHKRHRSLPVSVKEPHQPGQDTHDARAGNAPIGSLGHAEAGAGAGRQINAKAPSQPNYESDPDRQATPQPAATGTCRHQYWTEYAELGRS
jgi:hypothetical protein